MNARSLALALLLSSAAAGVGAETIAITGAKVHTLGSAGTIDGATVIVTDGRIVAVGRGLALPAGARRIDAAGKVVTPGLFDSLSQIGIVEVNGVEASSDTRVHGERFDAAFNVADALNPRSTLLPVNRIEGLTRAVVAPQLGGSLIAGQGAVIDLGAGPGYVLRSPAAMFAALGEAGAGLTEKNRGAAILRLREALEDALDYSRNRAAFERAERRPYLLSRLDLAALAPVARGELPLVLTVHRASDIESALKLAHDYHLKLILAGAAEGWIVARQIAAAGVPVLLQPLRDRPASFEQLGATLENAARLRRAGVTVAFMSGDSHKAWNLRQAAGNAAANGLPWEEALRAITTAPARIWGLADRYGTVEAGKDADLVIWDGDPLEVTTEAEKVFIRGVEMPMESRQTKLRERYRKLPPSFDVP
ncbi:MAG TPA: amidohydrolase family protein [Thermoanaerobaculia bacterium]|nr:amidohydrolase family protein [Thermoanaerobaculia bacterium]